MKFNKLIYKTMDYQRIKELVEKLGEFEMTCYKDCRDARKTLQEIKLEAQSLRDFINKIAKNKTYTEKTIKKVEEKKEEEIEKEINEAKNEEEPVLEKNEEEDELFLAR